ncbi:DegV family protein with EDD domain [Salsuginibacillus halophilus]|uniref:DegV family protein with EDD domain n=1 Tax=Salsuginibacillus halophilus TaxID=517424 RepID=A0A2P8HY54_9BACI|nr:DegV family protein [Salsuginibacillus halophilus]PSL51150.1 DegV family protein with EDD domain [Salsuginibacillus halophilus]
MSRVKIVTDSTADLPKELIEELDITVVPLRVTFPDGTTYQDGVDLTAEAFYEKLQTADGVPKTSQPTPHEFETVYKQVKETYGEDTTVLSLHLSSRLSGTYQAATIAKEEVEGLHIDVVDTKRASMAFGLIVLELARFAQSGADAQACRERLDDLLKKSRVFFVVDTLEYLQKNGRIGKASAMLGSLLKMKPILSLTNEGEVYAADKVRGKKKALLRMNDLLADEFKSKPVQVSVCIAGPHESSEEVLDMLKGTFDVQQVFESSIGPVIGAHVGPGTIAVAVAPMYNDA